MSKQKLLVTLIIVLVTTTGISYAKEKTDLIFGAIAVGKVSKIKKSLTPLIDYLEQQTGTHISFETGKDYSDTIKKFQSGYFDFGYIGPSPYVIATSGKEGENVLRIVAGLETNHKPFFHAVIIAARNNTQINHITDLKGKRFAFGSRQSTLSCYMPVKMLIDAQVFNSISEYKFLGKHDIVAKSVAMGKYEAGGIKEAVAKKYMKRIKIIAKSDPVFDFMIVTHKNMPMNQFKKIQKAVFALKDPVALNAIKKGVTGFVKTKDSNYQGLRNVMQLVDQKIQK